ncbi:MAG: branched-chain amino acid ABC transporter permease [Chloroflexi bacterium]|nr:branched-chain amino acid ABC transporter permease [Chloroflexota bacterium]
MELFLQQLVNGLMVGATYSLVAVGFTLIMGVMRVLQMAHPEVFMMGAFFGAILMGFAGLNIVVAFALAMAASALLGVAIERVAIRPLQGGGLFTPMISTIGVSIFLQNIGVRIFGYDPWPFPQPIKQVYYDVGELLHIQDFFLQFSNIQVLTFMVALIMMSGLRFLIGRTKLGRAIRATAENPDVASLLGVNTSRIVVQTMAIASALGGAAGIMIGMLYNTVWPFMGITYGFKGLVVLIIGGAGSLGGAMLGGLLLGSFESLTVGYLSSNYRDAIAFALLMVVLLVRPFGLFGKPT